MRKLRDTVRGQVDEGAFEEELARAVAAAESATSGDAEYALQSLLREAAVVLGEGSNPGVAVARRALARSKWSSGASHQALKQYRLVVTGLVRHGVQLNNWDMKCLLTSKDWQTLLAALSRSHRQHPVGVEHAVLVFASLRGLGRDPLTTTKEACDRLSLTTDAAIALTLLATIDILVQGGTDVWTAALTGQSPREQEWRRIVTDVVDAFAHDDHQLLVSSVQHAAQLSRATPAPVADLTLALCVWVALSADPLADNSELGAALASFTPQTRESAAIIEGLTSTYRLTSNPNRVESIPEGSAASLVALFDLSSLVSVRRHLLNGKRKQAAEQLGADTGRALFLPMALRRVYVAHARVGDLTATSPELLAEALQRSVSLSGVSASITVTLREALMLVHLRRGNVGKATAELVAWDATAPQGSRREARHVLASALVALGGQAPVPDFNPLPAVSLLGWRAQAMLSADLALEARGWDMHEPDYPDPRLVESHSHELDAGASHLKEKLGVAHPAIVAHTINELSDKRMERSAGFAERAGRLADWMLAHGYNAFLRVFKLRVAQGERLLKMGHTQHAVRVLTYATNRLDNLLPESRELRADARLLRAQAQIAARDLEGALDTLAVLDPVMSGQRAAAAYFAAVSQEGLGDFQSASAALKDSALCEGDDAHRFGITADAVQRRGETIEAKMAASMTEQIA